MSSPLGHSNVIIFPVRKRRSKQSKRSAVHTGPINIHRKRKSSAISQIKICQDCKSAYAKRCLRCIDFRWLRKSYLESFESLLDHIRMTKRERLQSRTRFVNAKTFGAMLLLLIELLQRAGGCNNARTTLLLLIECFSSHANKTRKELSRFYLSRPAHSL